MSFALFPREPQILLLSLLYNMADTTSIYDAFLNLHNTLSVPLTDGTIELDSGTLEKPIPSTIDAGSRLPSIFVSAGEGPWCDFCE